MRPGIELALLSCAANWPGAEAMLWYPPADERFKRWLSEIEGVRVQVETQRLPGSYGWNCKPMALLAALDAGADEAVWLDTDLLVTKNLDSVFNGLGADSLLVTEEPRSLRPDGGRPITVAWGFDPARSLPGLNSCVVRCTQRHRELLYQWSSLITSDSYRQAQSIHFRDRPVHMQGDQDVLTALMGAKRWADVPVELLRNAEDIIQLWRSETYPSQARLDHVRRGWVPYIVHAQRFKPWVELPREIGRNRLRRKVLQLEVELSPYRMHAKHFAADMLSPCGWLTRDSLLAKLSLLFTGRHPSCAALPIVRLNERRRSKLGVE